LKNTFGLFLVFQSLAVIPAASQAVESKEQTINWGKLAEEGARILSGYIKIDTTNPPGNETPAAQYLRHIFEKEGIEARVIEPIPRRGTIYAIMKGDGSKRALILNHHIDVVPAEAEFWKVGPFSGLIQNGYAYGRGAIDDKGIGIVHLMTMIALKRNNVPLKRDIIFIGNADEEVQKVDAGARWLARDRKDLLRNAEWVIAGRGGKNLYEEGRLKYFGISASEKTILFLRIVAKGEPGHAFMPRSDTSVNRLLVALNKLLSYQWPIKVSPHVEKFFREVAPLQLTADQRTHFLDIRKSLLDEAFAESLTQDNYYNALLRDTCSITMLQGSNKVNNIPTIATADMYCALLPGENVEDFLAQLTRILGGEDGSIAIATNLRLEGTPSSYDTELFRVIAVAVDELERETIVTTSMHLGGTDSKHYRDAGIISYGISPFKLKDQELNKVHGNNERLSVDNLEFGIRLLYAIIQKLNQ
jgi:acetylornithine deacetylase/succinyl-diaminopimelate desuccinylase-like protein